MATGILPSPQVQAPIVREYLRVSADRSGRQRSMTEQHADNARAASAHGFVLGEPYQEKAAVSASRYSTKTRDGFDDLISDLSRGRFGAGVLMMWESSRSSRRVGEWVTLIELCEENGVQIYVTSHGKMYDPANPRDRRALLEDAMDSEYESSKISMRVRRTMAEQAAAGRPHGAPPYGYRRVFDPQTGRLINWEPDPGRASVVLELFQRLRKGESLKSIARGFAAAGVCNRSGTPFTPAHLRSMIKPVYAAYRDYKGELIDGVWPPIVDRALYWEVRRIVTAPERKTTRHGRAVHEFTMILRCDVCLGPLAITTRSDGKRPGRPQYQCHLKGCIRIDQDGVDEIVLGAIWAYLSRDDIYTELAATPKDTAELDQAEQEVPASVHQARALAKLTEGLTERIATAQTRQRELTTPPALTALIQPGADVAARWQAAPVSARRKAAEILLSPRYLGEVRITPSPLPGHRAPAVDRIVWHQNAR